MHLNWKTPMNLQKSVPARQPGKTTAGALYHLALRWCTLLATTALGTLTLGAQAWAQQEADRPLWEVGAVGLGVSQQAYPGASESIGRALVIPFGIYRGEWLRVEGGGANLRAMNTPRFELDLGVSG